MNNPSDRVAYFPSLPGLLPSLILVGVGILITLPALWSGNVLGYDSLSHLVMSQHFIDQFAMGELYPRWLVRLNDGLGSPVMFFYGPVSYYLTALFRPLVGSDPEGWHQLGLAAALAVIASGFSAYAWLQRLGTSSAALIGALLYMGAPYHLKVDFYQRFAFAELWGFVWMPLVLWRVHAVTEGSWGAVLGLAVCYALLIMTHLPTTLLFSVVPPLYALYLAKAGCRIRVGAKVAAGMLLGVGLSAVFLVPALLLQSFVQSDVIQNGIFYFGNNFLFYGPRFTPGPDEGLNYQDVVVAGSSMLLIAGTYGLGKRLLPASGVRIARFWFLVGMAVFFMMLPLSKPVWELLPVLQKVQYPYRFGTVQTLSMAALLALWLGASGRLFSRSNITLLVIVGLVALLQAVSVLKVYQAYPSLMKKPSLDGLLDQFVGQERKAFNVIVEGTKINAYPFFLPNGVDPLLFGIPFGEMQSLNILRSLASVPEVAVIQPTPGLSLLQLSHVTPRHLMLTVQSETPASLRIRQLYFPGWVAAVRGGSAELKVHPSRPSGLIEVDVPAGRHEIDLVLQPTSAERAGQIISLLSAVVFFAGWARLRYLTTGARRFLPAPQGAPVRVEAADRSTHHRQD